MASIAETIAKIRSFQTLPVGWHFGDGGPIGYDQRERAIGFVRLATKYGIRRADAFPGVEGEIGVSFYDGVKTLAIRLEINDSYSFIIDESNKILEDDYEVSRSRVEVKLWEFSQTNRIMSELSTLDIGSPSKTDFRILLSLVHHWKMVAASHQSLQNALPGQETPFATISDIGIPQQSLAILPFSTLFPTH